MSAVVQSGRGTIADIFDWLNLPLTPLRPITGHPMRVEDLVRDGEYVVRAEIPGINPEKDIDVTVAKGILTIQAERQEKTEGKHHSEFHYGTFTRSVTLPPSADEERIRASYDNGVLEVAVGLRDTKPSKELRHVPVKTGKKITAT